VSAKSTEPSSPQPPPSFEEALGRLEDIVHELEEGDLGLAESLGQYETGIGLLKQCYGLLEGAERRIALLNGVDGEGNPTTQPFDDAAPSLEEKVQKRGRRRSNRPAAADSGFPADTPQSDVDEDQGQF
jgi:exodeoxyribonuclease VII small subunit